MPRRHGAGKGDAGSGYGVVHFLMTFFIFMTMFLPVVIRNELAPWPDPPPPNLGRFRLETNLRDAIETGLLLPSLDPSGSSLVEDVAREAHARDDPLVFWRVVKRWMEAPEATVMTFTEVRVGMDGESKQRVHLVRPWEPDGEAVGVVRPARIADRGPAHVFAPLDKVGGAASQDVYVIPLDRLGAYRDGFRGEHATWTSTSVEYTRTSTNNQLDLELNLDQWQEASGAYFPAMDVHFMERDWLDPLADPDARFLSLALTQEELAAERLIEDPLAGPTDPYPQHSFRVDVSLLGPGQVAESSRSEGLAEGERVEREAVKITVTIPRQWTQVEFDDFDVQDNDGNNWILTDVSLAQTGEHVITGVLVVNGAHADSLDPETNPRPGLKIVENERVDASFFFHGRPPPLSDSADLGFYRLSATVESVYADVRQEGFLVAELATNPGRVHRSMHALAPAIVPRTPVGNGVDVPLGFVLANGAESTEITRVTWTAPPGTFLETVPAPATVDGASFECDWDVAEDGSSVTCTPASLLEEPPVPTTCLPLDACWTAAYVRVDGASLARYVHWPQPEALVLYDEADVDLFVEAFVMTDQGHQPTPYGAVGGRAMAFHAATTRGGPVRGAYAWALPPTPDTLCTNDDMEERNRWRHEDATGRRRQDWGPVEGGYPAVAVDVPDGCALPTADARFPLLALVGTTGEAPWGVRSVGKTAYESPPSLPAETITSWRNGVSESHVTGPDELRLGGQGNFIIRIDALVDALAGAAVERATLTARIVDPFNAWEDAAWYERVLVDGAEPDLLQPPENCAVDPNELCGEYLGPEFAVPVPIPLDAATGTHLFQAVVTWEFLNDVGDLETQTARIVLPFDVILRATDPPGADDRALPGTVEALAWLRDWEIPHAT